MEDDETVLSDVHVLTPFFKDESKNVAITRFIIKTPSSTCSTADNTQADNSDCDEETAQDSDGDFIIDREKTTDRQNSCEVITIEHQLATVLKDVGLQVWRDALLLADFIIHKNDMFSNCYGLELGAGVGLCSVVLARVADTVFCTDVGDDVLKNCQRNADMNAHLFKKANSQGSVIKVKELDWTKGMVVSERENSFHWSRDDIDDLSKVTVIFAADVIYDDNLTDTLFVQIVHLLQQNPKAMFYLSIEKRLNFTLDDLDVSCPAYKHFLRTTTKLQSQKILQVKQISTEFPQYLEYERVKEFSNCYGLELGAGVGLCSVVLARVADTVFCTDVGDNVLKNCQRNADMNAHLFKNANSQGSVIKVKELDWTKGMVLSERENSFHWSRDDIDDLSKVTVIFAADVIYDDNLTDTLFVQIVHLLQQNPKAMFYLSIEKRLNFTLDDLDVSCPAYRHFLRTTTKLQSQKILQVKQISTEFPQYLEYERVKELELWEICALKHL